MSIFTNPSLHNSARWKNMRIGLLGGSFNPPHQGHVHISLAALKALKLDAVWWLVSPQNPLKTEKPLPSEDRIRLSEELIQNPKILVSGIEEDLGTSITYYTIRKLKSSFPTTRFVWLSGMDNAHSLHRWHHWQDLLGEICMAHITRAPAQSLVKRSPLKNYNKQKHVFLSRGGALPLDSGTTYWLMQKKMIDLSSTSIREKANKSNT
tara:strand:+ start:1135 stop:1758 length:624 start_codon:yes stop_codon:yes gene_type:complete